MKTCNLIFFLIFSFRVFSQTYELSGNVADLQTSESLPGAHIHLLNENKDLFHSVSNIDGNFTIKGIRAGNYKIMVSSLGYEKHEEEIDIQTSKSITIKLKRQLISLGEVVVSSTRQEQIIKEVPIPLEIVNRSQIEQASSFTVSDVLQQEPGIALGRDGVWATGINIRGFGEQRIVMMVDGNRIETATDLMASMAFFDVDDIDRIEVIKGSTSSLYGTGAMGGIVNVISKDGYFNSTPYFNGSFNAGYSDANELFTRKLTFNSGSDKWFIRLSGSLRDADDVRTPEGILKNSQFSDKGVSFSAGVKPFKNHTLKLNYQLLDADDVGIPGGSAFLGPSSATYSDAKRQMVAANYQIENISSSFKKLNIKYFYQYIVRDVELLPNSPIITSTRITTPELFTPTGEHTTHGIQFQSDWSFSLNNTFIAGIDAWQRKIITSREKFIRVDVLNSSGDIIATNNLVRGETPIPEATFGTAGIYLQNEQKLLSNKLKLVLGARLDGVRIANEQALDIDYLITNGVRNDTPPNQRITFEENEEYKISWSANLGALYALTEEMDLSFNAGRSFRAPSLEESFKYIDLGSKVRLGDPGLDPEKGFSIDAGFRIWKPKFNLKVNGFINWIDDMIVEKDDEFIYTLTTGVVDTIPALVNANVDKARLYGIDFNIEYNVFKTITLMGSGSFVRGEDTKNSTSLPLIPPVNGRLGIKYEIPKYLSMQLFAIGFADQPKIALGEKETMGYARFDFSVYSALLTIKFAKIQLFGGVENIFDRGYRNHLATNRGSIDIEPGRNIYMKVKVLF